jgi:hypothetical protein
LIMDNFGPEVVPVFALYDGQSPDDKHPLLPIFTAKLCNCTEWFIKFRF